MAAHLSDVALVLAMLAAIFWGIRRFLAPASELGLTIFRPWRGDPWPIGVQEDDDARFNWAEPEPVAVLPMVGPTPRRPAKPSREERNPERQSPVGERAAIEDLSRASVETAPLEHVQIRGPRG